MEIYEALGWFVTGFAPTLVAMDVAWRIGKRRLTPMEAKIP
jgi:hypothetical protein